MSTFQYTPFLQSPQTVFIHFRVHKFIHEETRKIGYIFNFIFYKLPDHNRSFIPLFNTHKQKFLAIFQKFKSLQQSISVPWFLKIISSPLSHVFKHSTEIFVHKQSVKIPELAGNKNYQFVILIFFYEGYHFFRIKIQFKTDQFFVLDFFTVTIQADFSTKTAD